MKSPGDRIAMSQRERDVLKTMAPVLSGHRTQEEAGRLLGRSERQIRRIQRRIEAEGDVGVVHRLRGRPSNRHLPEALRERALSIYAKEYSDFGPTLAAEKLAERGVLVSGETLRLWLIEKGWHEPRRAHPKHRRRRPRRACFGELVQADGSPHDWLEGRGPRMTLLAMIDDATSWAVARFYPAETTEGYMDLLRRYLRAHGRMVWLYADGHRIFQNMPKGDGTPPPPTQLGRALAELDIGLIKARSPQAKGRIERFNRTAQDRLVKELRLAGASTLEEANAVLDARYLPWFNRVCTVEAASVCDAHRPVHGSMNLASILSRQTRRTVSNDYTVRHGNAILQLLPPARPGLRGGQVIVEERLDGTRHIRFKGKAVAWEVFSAPAEPPALVGAPPPRPRSLPHGGNPASGQAAGATQGEGRPALDAERPDAVYPAAGRSGRTPAEPCPPGGAQKDIRTGRARPGPNHPWRQSWKDRPARQPDISTLPK